MIKKRLLAHHETKDGPLDVVKIVAMCPTYFWGGLMGFNQQDPDEDFNGPIQGNLKLIDTESGEFWDTDNIYHPKDDCYISFEVINHTGTVIFNSDRLMTDIEFQDKWVKFCESHE